MSDATPAPLAALGPKTTLHAVLQAYPFLEQPLLERDAAFGRLKGERGRRWARTATLGDVAVSLNIPWRQLARDLASEIGRAGEHAPPVLDPRRPVAGDDARLGELQAIIDELEGGGSLPALAARLEELTTGLDETHTRALERALAAGQAGEEVQATERLRSQAAAGDDVAPPPAGHPLDTHRREGRQLRRLCDDFRVEIDRLGGSPSRRRWRAARPLIERLVQRLSAVELRFRRHQQAWFPALAVHDIDGPAILLRDSQAEALELLRRLRHAVDGDDAAFVVEIAVPLLDTLDHILAADDQVLAPLAERNLSPGDWAAVRELEDAVGWGLLPSPPPWPGAETEPGPDAETEPGPDA